MKTIYESTFTTIGSSAMEALQDNFLITFGEGAPPDVAEYCFIHRNDRNDGCTFGKGAMIAIDEQTYPITAVDAVARKNLSELGHITVRFDGAAQAEYPGTIHVSGSVPARIRTGQKFRVLSA